MGFWNSLGGTVRVRITSASVEKILTAINDHNIELTHANIVDDLTVEVTVQRHYYRLLCKIVDQKGDKLEILNRFGVYWHLRALGSRPILVSGILLYIVLAFCLPTRIFFVKVSGNQTVSANTVISQAEKCGISFGASRRTVRSEQVKNALLSSVPQLQWVGVNTYGCVAVISVKERVETPENQAITGVRSIIAKQDGIIKSLTVTRGNVLCKVGQAVKAGQVLVSGYTDCGISIKATSAEAEIYAQTMHSLNVRSPMDREFRQQQIKKKTNYSIIIGKKLIKLYKDSGISDAGCVKMYEEQYLTLPGGFQLPIALVSEVQLSYTTGTENLDENTVADLTETQADAYLREAMLAGTILSAQTATQVEADMLLFDGEYACVEMIGQSHYEEIITGNE